MRKFILALGMALGFFTNAKTQGSSQLPCGGPEYRQFDFWLGNWEAYNKAGKKAGDSKISRILDSCIILEEWTSTASYKGVVYSGKSFNTWNSATGQWQQTWVDNVGGSTAYLHGKFENNQLQFLTDPYVYSKDTMAVLRLTFYNLGPDEVRQFGEISKDNGATWAPQFDLDYRRKKN